MPLPDELALLSVEESYRADQLAAAQGIPGIELMEQAGRGLFEVITARWEKEELQGHAAILCGPGNNGGDGFVLARLLAEAGWPVRVALLGERARLKGDAAHHAGLWAGEVEPLSPAVLEGAALAVDALFGAGLSRPLEGKAAEIVRRLNDLPIPVVAVDVPSGLQGDSGAPLGEVVIQAQVTVTFFRPKPGHLLLPGRKLSGDLQVVDIGIPASVLEAIVPRCYRNGPELWLKAWPRRGAESHKYHFGHALILGGGIMTGAARLAGRAALRVGAGLVTLLVPPEAVTICQLASASLIVRPAATAEAVKELLQDKRFNALLVGPGFGSGAATRTVVRLLLEAGRATVLDADALTSFGENPSELFGLLNDRCVLTPHDGEFARLFPDLQGDRLTRARRAAERSGAVVLLKGADSVIAHPDGRATIVENAPPQLATAGTGDVLSGLITGLLAQGMSAFDAAAAGAWLLGEAGQEGGTGLISDDLPELLPRLRARLGR